MLTESKFTSNTQILNHNFWQALSNLQTGKLIFQEEKEGAEFSGNILSHNQVNPKQL